MKHTKGPWRQGEISYQIEANVNLIDRDNYTADLVTEVLSDNPADASLIAASPEMLETLQLVQKRLLEFLAQIPTNQRLVERAHIQTTLSLMSPVLSKATGGVK